MTNHRFSPYKMISHNLDCPHPINVQLDLTGACNHRCVFCYFRSGRRTDRPQDYIKKIGFIKTAPVLQVLDELKTMRVKAITLVGGGEPLLHKDFDLILERVVKNKLKFGVVTNLYRLPLLRLLRRASWIRVSADAATDQTYQLIHQPMGNFSFSTLVDNIRAIAGRTDVGISFIVRRENYHEIASAAKLFKSLGVNYIQFKPEYDSDHGKRLKPLLPAIRQQLSRAMALADRNFDVIDLMSRIKDLDRPQRNYRQCRIHHYNVQIGVDGKVYPCCVLKYISKYSFGSIYRESFRNIWNGKRRQRIIKELTADQCPPCWYDRTNEMLDYYFEEKSDHRYFV